MTADVECRDGLATCRVPGTLALSAAVQYVEDAIVETRRLQCDRLLVDAGALTRIAPVSLAMRHEVVRRWAMAAEGAVRFAIVLPPHLIDPESFGITAAANFGMVANRFANAEDARAWLAEP